MSVAFRRRPVEVNQKYGEGNSHQLRAMSLLFAPGLGRRLSPKLSPNQDGLHWLNLPWHVDEIIYESPGCQCSIIGQGYQGMDSRIILSGVGDGIPKFRVLLEILGCNTFTKPHRK